MFAIVSHIVKMLPWRQAAVPALLVLLTVSVSAGAEPTCALSYSNCAQLLEKLDKKPGATRDEWSHLIQSLLSVNKTEKNRVIADKSLFLAGKAALELYRRAGKPEDLDSAVRYLGDFTKTYRKDPSFIEGLKTLKEADTLRRKLVQLVREKPTSVQVAHSPRKAPSISAPPDQGQKMLQPEYQRPDTTLMLQSSGGENWNRPAYRHAGNPFWTPRNRNRGQDAGSPAPSSVASTVTDMMPPTRVPLAPPPGQAVNRTNDSNPPAARVASPQPDLAPPRISTPATANEPAKELQETPVQTRLASVAPSAKPDREAEKKHECSAKGYVVVLDPGHGGRDPGAISQDGALKEKDITLEVAKATKRILEKNNPGITVELTRSDDKFMNLEARTALANRLNADLFISIHCNSDTDANSAGIETYYLSQATSDEKAMKVAATENSMSLAKMSDLQATLLDLIVTSKKTESEELATAVSNSLERAIPKGRHRGVKQAPFYVLLGAKMPAVLVECAFISSSRESKKLHSPEYLNTVAQGLANGAHSYIQGLGPSEGKLLQSAGRTAKISK
jgi:N-acetylmuramoyl-L-alanine amidase